MGSATMTLPVYAHNGLTDCHQETTVTHPRVESLRIDKIRKHPLGSSWTFWFYKNDRNQTWEQSQQKVLTVSTVEDFWGMNHHLVAASALSPGSDYALFKEGIFPDWEDRRNAPGGRWIITTDKRRRQVCLDGYWLDVLLLLIGENKGKEVAEQMNGAAIQVRGKTDKLAVWLADCQDLQFVESIGVMVKETLKIPKDNSIKFSIHQEEKAKINDPTRLIV